MRKTFGMFTAEGDQLISSMVATAKRMIKDGALREDVTKYLRERWAKIGIAHEEADDSAVTGLVLVDLNSSFTKAYGDDNGLISNGND